MNFITQYHRARQSIAERRRVRWPLIGSLEGAQITGFPTLWRVVKGENPLYWLIGLQAAGQMKKLRRLK